MRVENQIAEILGNPEFATNGVAEEVRDVIDEEWLLDWSECTKGQMKKAVELAYSIIQEAVA
jgi:hypothetical protein